MHRSHDVEGTLATFCDFTPMSRLKIKNRVIAMVYNRVQSSLFSDLNFLQNLINHPFKLSSILKSMGIY